MCISCNLLHIDTYIDDKDGKRSLLKSEVLPVSCSASRCHSRLPTTTFVVNYLFFTFQLNISFFVSVLLILSVFSTNKFHLFIYISVFLYNTKLINPKKEKEKKKTSTCRLKIPEVE